MISVGVMKHGPSQESTGKEWITRKIGLSEVYHPDCIVHKYQRKIGWMFWGCMSGRYGKGIGIFWEKSWGKINKASYSERIIPRLSKSFKPIQAFNSNKTMALGILQSILQSQTDVRSPSVI
jgi:hypothetical protein